jgi:hypothetical protein
MNCTLAIDATELRRQVAAASELLLQGLDVGFADSIRARIANLSCRDIQVEIVPAVEALGLVARIRCDFLDELRAAALRAPDCQSSEVRDA